MIEKEFEVFLSSEATITSQKAIISRIARARKAECILGKTLDSIVSNDETMYEAIIALQPHEDPAHTPMQNAVRKYYKFKNGKEFPKLKDYRLITSR